MIKHLGHKERLRIAEVSHDIVIGAEEYTFVARRFGHELIDNGKAALVAYIDLGDIILVVAADELAGGHEHDEAEGVLRRNAVYGRAGAVKARDSGCRCHFEHLVKRPCVVLYAIVGGFELVRLGDLLVEENAARRHIVNGGDVSDGKELTVTYRPGLVAGL